jgi:glycine cleavage system H protein
MPTPPSCRCTETHEWHRPEGKTVVLGITQFAVNELTDITYVEMKAVGTVLKAGDAVGEVESVKATSDIYSAVGGRIIEVNTALSDDPSLVNTDPYGKGWLIKIEAADTAPLNNLLDAASYDKKYPA